MSDEEPRMTEEEWKDKERARNLVSSVRHALIGRVIKDRETYDQVMYEVFLSTGYQLQKELNMEKPTE